MSVIRYIKRIQRIDGLIRRKSTGTAEELAEKMHLSRSAIMEYIHDMRILGFPIVYDKKRQCFYYEKDGRMTDHFFEESLSEEEMKKTKGGSGFIRGFQSIRK